LSRYGVEQTFKVDADRVGVDRRTVVKDKSWPQHKHASQLVRKLPALGQTALQRAVGMRDQQCLVEVIEDLVLEKRAGEGWIECYRIRDDTHTKKPYAGLGAAPAAVAAAAIRAGAVSSARR
jgi:hypothetical protein